MNKKILFGLIGLIGLVVCLGAFFASQQEVAEQPKPTETSKVTEVSFGAVLPMSGSLALLGEYEHNGLELAVEHLNNKTDQWSFKLLAEDSKGNAATGVTGAQRLLNIEKTDYIYTSLTQVSLAISPLFKEREGIQVIFGMDEKMSEAGANVLRIYPGIREEGKSIVQVVESIKPKKVAILTFEHPAIDAQVAEVLIPSLSGSGIEVIAETFTAADEKAVRNVVAKLFNTSPDLLILNAYYSQLPLVMRTVESAGFSTDIPVIGGLNMAIAFDEGSLKDSKLEKLYFAIPTYLLPDSDEDRKRREEFESAYFAKYNKQPDYNAAYAYDAGTLLGAAVQASGGDPAAAKKQMMSLENYKGVTGNLRLDASGNALTEWTAAVAEGNKYIRYLKD